MILRLLLAAIFGIVATAAIATPTFDVSTPAQCKLGLHCPITITKRGAATSYSDVVVRMSGTSVLLTNGMPQITVRFLRADTTKTVYAGSLAVGPYTATIARLRYALIGQATAIGNVVGNEPPPPPAPLLVVESTKVAENAGAATVKISRTGILTQASSVIFATGDVTATAGINYKGTSGTITFPPGQAEAAISIPVLDDGKVQGDLILNILLSGFTNAALGANGTLTITNTDVAPPATQTCWDGTVIPATSTCPPVPPPPPPAGMARALQSCASVNGNGQSLIVGNLYSIVGYAGWSTPGGPKPPEGTKDIVILNDATHLGDGWFGLWVTGSCIATQ